MAFLSLGGSLLWATSFCRDELMYFPLWALARTRLSRPVCSDLICQMHKSCTTKLWRDCVLLACVMLHELIMLNYASSRKMKRLKETRFVPKLKSRNWHLGLKNQASQLIHAPQPNLLISITITREAELAFFNLRDGTFSVEIGNGAIQLSLETTKSHEDIMLEVLFVNSTKDACKSVTKKRTVPSRLGIFPDPTLAIILQWCRQI